MPSTGVLHYKCPEARPQNFKVGIFGILTGGWNSFDKGVPKVPAPGGVTGPINCGVRQQNFPRFRKYNKPCSVTLRWFWTNQRQLSGQDKDSALGFLGEKSSNKTGRTPILRDRERHRQSRSQS
ncbi:hypothetical protein TNCV_5038071 [Trichonephila clavipes]|nr:hypothetical protein TNCV_5038071 [Trichonephila clavipes]